MGGEVVDSISEGFSTLTAVSKRAPAAVLVVPVLAALQYTGTLGTKEEKSECSELFSKPDELVLFLSKLPNI